jgi:pimeloyl-ACP methyl ester carboxylesterase
MIRRTITVMGRETTYWERNPEWPLTIVLLHGFRGNHKGLLDVGRQFPGFRVIIPDLPGYGESEPLSVKHTLRNYALWLDAFAGAIYLDEWICWSHSYSGSISLIQAASGTHKPQCMISVSMAVIRRSPAILMSTLYYRAGTLLPKNFQQHLIASRMLDHAAGRWLFMTASTQRRRELQERAERDLPTLNAKVVTEEYLSALTTNLEYYARRVEVPVLMVAGARDIVVPLRRLEHITGLMENVTLTVMDDQGHLAPIERPAAVGTITKRFIHNCLVAASSGQLRNASSSDELVDALGNTRVSVNLNG